MRAPTFFSSLRQASFRGVPFEVDDVEASGGRRVVLHEYPLRDTPYSEDLGRRARDIRVRGYIIQGRMYDYASARAGLLKALEAYGPGELVHPWHGEVRVVVDDYRLRETTEQGGLLELDIRFREAGQLTNPAATTDTAQSVTTAATSVRQALKDSFLLTFAPALERLDSLAGVLDEAVGLAMDYLGLPKSLMAAGLARMQSLLATPAALFDALSGLFGDLLGNGNEGTAVTTASGTAARTSSRAVISASSDALERLLGGSAVITSPAGRVLRDMVAQVVVVEAAASTAHTDYTTADDALADRDAVVESLDTIEPVAGDSVFRCLAGLRRAVVTDLTTRGAELPRVRSVTLPGTMPALVAAYRIHADAGRADELVSRNRIRHPGRVPGGTPLEVLSE
ncbi:DNA circularization protein [Desulfovibrio piger]|uniref:DNA circularization protein n=1 Tax=Desulfovibrio piger TaxID=901 RepID=UPI003078000F